MPTDYKEAYKGMEVVDILDENGNKIEVNLDDVYAKLFKPNYNITDMNTNKFVINYTIFNRRHLPHCIFGPARGSYDVSLCKFVEEYFIEGEVLTKEQFEDYRIMKALQDNIKEELKS